MSKIQVLSLGGGRQSTLCVILSALNVIARPDFIVIADTGYEINTTWQYLNDYTIPFVRQYALPEIIIAEAKTYASYDLYGGTNGSTILPLYIQNGGMMRKFCSSNWKRDVIRRCVAEITCRPQTHQVHWIGLGVEEKRRWVKKISDQKYYLPLVDKNITEDTYEYWYRKVSLPIPQKSACYFCPFRSDFSSLNNEEIKKTIEIEQEINDTHELMGLPKAYFHRARQSFNEVKHLPNKEAQIGETCDDGCFT